MGQATDAPVSLNAMDDSLAADFDQMLEGNFESIDAVLEGVFDEKAALVQSPGGPVVAIKREEPSPEPAPLPSAVSQLVEVEASSPTPSSVETPAPPPIAAVDVPPPITHPEPIAAAPAPVHQIETHAPPVAPERERPSKKTDTKPRKSGPGIIVKFLMAMNYPLRLVPDTLKPTINLVSLSLAAWVPIVWIVVILKSGPTQSASTEAAPPIESEPTAEATPH